MQGFAHPLHWSQREREKERWREREKEEGRESDKEGDGERAVGYGCSGRGTTSVCPGVISLLLTMVALKGMMGALAPFSYLI